MVTKSGRYKGGTCTAGERELGRGWQRVITEKNDGKPPQETKEMQSNISACCFSLLLVHFIGAKPISDLQSLNQLLGNEISNMPFSSEEAEESDFSSDKSVLGTPGLQEPWSSSDRRTPPLGAKDDALERFLKDLVRASNRSWSRYKKGGLRSCFGVRLERIGSFSGLGC